MIPLSLVISENVPIFEQLQLEEALLRADQRNWCLINIGTPPAIVMGISGKPEVLIDAHTFNELPIPLIRRFSGGGTVIVDGHTVFVTWIFNAETIDVACCPQKIHRWTEKFYQQALPTLDMQLVENDYVMAGRKFGGNAQYLCKGRWLHHSSLLWDYDPAMMQYLLMPPKVPSYRQGRQHDDFLCRLRDHIPEKSLVVQQIQQSIRECFLVHDVNKEELQKIKCLPHRQATQQVSFEKKTTEGIWDRAIN